MIRSKVGVDTGSLQVPLTLILKVPPFDGVVVLRMQTPSQRLEEPGCAGDVVPPAAAGLAVSAMQAKRVLAMEGIELLGDGRHRKFGAAGELHGATCEKGQKRWQKLSVT